MLPRKCNKQLFKLIDEFQSTFTLSNNKFDGKHEYGEEAYHPKFSDLKINEEVQVDL